MRSGGRCVKGFFLSFVLTLFISQAHATDVPPGNIAADEIWALVDSPFIVSSDVSINTSVVLTIEAGVVVKFDLNTALIVNGTIIARGTANSQITFTANNSGELWNHINFTVGSVDAAYDGAGNYLSGSIIEYATIENAGNQTNPADGAIQLFDAHPYLNQLIVQNNNATGIYGVGLTSFLKIRNSVISGNTSSPVLGGGGISLDGVAGSRIEISGNTIQNNNTLTEGGGVRVIDVDVLDFDSNTVSGNQADADGGGIYINNLQGTNAENFIRNNTINNNIANADNAGANAGGGIWANSSDISITNNTIVDNDAEEGGGIVLGQSLTASAIISKNLIMGNNAVINGGGMHIDNGFHTVSGNVIYNNASSDPNASHGGGIDVHEGSITITNNIIASNSSYKWFLNLPGVVTFDNNSIVDNYVTKQTGGFSPPAIILTQAASMQQNTISGNDSKTGSLVAYLSPTIATNMSNNNFLNNSPGFLVSNPPAGVTVIAQNVWWGTADAGNISLLVSGDIDVSAPASEPLIATPISPPTGVSATAGNGEIIVNWGANSEADVSGYKVYWGTTPAPNFTDVADVGNATAHVIPALASDVYYVAVTAYDSDPRVDDVATKVNEDMTSGVESWFSLEQNLSFFNSDLAVAIIRDATGSVNAGDQVTYVVTVTNNGPDVANNIIMTSTLPAGATFISAPGCNENNGIVECSLVSLASSAPGNSTSFDIVIAAPVVAGASTNTVMVSSIDKDSVGTNNTASLDFDVIPVADVSVSISAPQYVASGRSILYEVMVTNNGPSVANTVVVESTLPVGVTFNSAADGCTENAGTVTCTIGMLGTSLFNKTAIFGITVDTVGLTGVISNSVVVSAADIDLDGSNNMATVSTTVLGEADLEMMMSAVTSVTVGDSVDYQFSVKNNGPSIATNVVVVFVISDGVTLVSMSNGCEEINNELICTLNLLDSASSGTFNLMVTAPAVAGGIMASATVTADNIDPNPVNNTISVETTVNASVDTTVNERSSGGGGSLGGFLFVLLACSVVIKIFKKASV